MAIAGLGGGFCSLVGPSTLVALGVPASTTTTIDAANEAAIYIGRIATSDGGSHTIDPSGSSSLGWRSGSLTFANGGTTVIVGLAAVDAATGPPPRAANAADVITFDVSKSLTGGGGGITANAWQTHVPDTGTKTIAHGDLVAFAVQATARGGTDAIRPTHATINAVRQRPSVTNFTGGSYAASTSGPNIIITFSDGAIGWFFATDVFSVQSTRTWNSGSATKEYGQLYQLQFPTKVYGIYGWVAPSADTDLVLYSDPLGTPVAEKTISIDSNTTSVATGALFFELFPAPYTAGPNQKLGAVFKPGGTDISAYYKTIASAGHRVSDAWATGGYGISRASGAFADANSSLDHYYIGLIVGAFEHGVNPNYALGI